MRHIHSKLPTPYLKAFGKIAAGTAKIERAMIPCIKALSGINDELVILCFVGGENFDAIKSKLVKLFRYKVKDAAMRNKFENILTRIGELNETRNICVHSTWVEDKETDSFLAVRLPRSNKFTRTDEVRLADLQKTIKGMDKIEKDLARLIIGNIERINAKFQARRKGIDDMLRKVEKEVIKKLLSETKTK